jgi:hypothetical protein
MPYRNLLLIPGTLYDAELWRHQIDHLGDVANLHVGRHSMDDTVDVIAHRLLDEMPPGHFGMAGLSMGGYLALEGRFPGQNPAHAAGLHPS